MTKYCSKKVLIASLCFTTILFSLLIGRNLYQGTPTFQKIVASKSTDTDDDGNARRGGGRRIQDNNLRLDIIRHGGFANDGANMVHGNTQETAGTGPDDNSSEISIDFTADVQKPQEGQIDELTLKERFGSERAQDNHPVVKWSPASDPRVPRMLSKILMSMPKAVKQDVPEQYKTLGRRGQFGVTIGTQWQVISDAYARHGMKQRLPDVLNIGVKKSGTNAVGFFVTQHPQIVHSIGNEVHFFDRNLEKGYEYYRARMGYAKENQFSFEKTPKYFVTQNAPRQILENLPKNVKFILSVRDPVKRAMSDFRHERELKIRRSGKMPGMAKGQALRNTRTTGEEEGKLFEQEVLDKHGNVNASNVIVDTSNYAKHFQHWLKYFPRDRFLVIDLDILEKGAFHKLIEFEQFLGLDPYFKESMFYYDKTRHGTCMHGARRACPAKSTPGFIPKAEPSESTLKKLYDFYRPSNEEFMKLTGLDFQWAHL